MTDIFKAAIKDGSVWRLSNDDEKILEADQDPDGVIWASSIEELEVEVALRTPVPDGFTRCETQPDGYHGPGVIVHEELRAHGDTPIDEIFRQALKGEKVILAGSDRIKDLISAEDFARYRAHSVGEFLIDGYRHQRSFTVSHNRKRAKSLKTRRRNVKTKRKTGGEIPMGLLKSLAHDLERKVNKIIKASDLIASCQLSSRDDASKVILRLVGLCWVVWRRPEHRKIEGWDDTMTKILEYAGGAGKQGKHVQSLIRFAKVEVPDVDAEGAA